MIQNIKIIKNQNSRKTYPNTDLYKALKNISDRMYLLH